LDVFKPKTVIMIIFWDVVPCSLISFQRSLLSLFSEQKCHWAAGSSKTLLPTYKTTQCYIPQYQILDNFSYKNSIPWSRLKAHNRKNILYILSCPTSIALFVSINHHKHFKSKKLLPLIHEYSQISNVMTFNSFCIKNTYTFIDYKLKINIMPQNIKQSRLKFL